MALVLAPSDLRTRMVKVLRAKVAMILIMRNQASSQKWKIFFSMVVVVTNGSGGKINLARDFFRQAAVVEKILSSLIGADQDLH